MSELPAGWAETPMSNLLSGIEAGRSFKGSERRAERDEWGVVKVSSMTWGEFDEAENKAVLSARQVDPRFEIRPGDLLFSRANTVAYVGAIVQVRATRPRLLLSDKSLRLVPRSGVSPRWLLYFLRSQHARRYLESVATGTSDSMRNISQANLRNLIVPLAPLHEQDLIIASIEEQFSRLDIGAVTLERVRHNLKHMRSVVLRAAMSGQLVGQEMADGTGADLLGRIAKKRGGKRSPVEASADLIVPETWTATSLESVTDPSRVICYGILMPKVREGGTIPYVEVKDLRANRLNIAALHRTSVALHREFSRSQLNSGDVVLAIRGSYNRALVVPEEVAGGNVSRDVARIAPLPGIDASFLSAYLMSPAALRYLHERAHGVAVKGINIADLRSMPIPVPPAEEQKRIARKVSEIDSIIEQLESVLDSAKARVATIRHSVLNAAFSGKLIPQDPTDDPASALLQRIAAELAASNGSDHMRTSRTRVVRREVGI